MTNSLDHKPIRLAVLLSGNGTTLQNLADQVAEGRLNASIEVVISSNPDAYGLTRARQLNVPSVVVTNKDFPNLAARSAALFAQADRYQADLVCLAGYMSLLEIPDSFLHRVINIHPALLPAFGGKGMYGQRVHQAVLDTGCKVSGCTVHYCDQTYDTGPIIVQRTCPVRNDDTPETLAKRVYEQECLAYPEAISLIAAGRVKVEGRRTKIDDAEGSI